MSAADQSVRDRALDIGESFAVSAPAGSGKTGLLIRRTLRLLAVCDQPEQVLGITFTRKAAAEMQERIIQALILARNDTPPDDEYQQAIWRDARRVLERDAALNWQLTASPSRLRIMTIDSLCRTLARQLAVETALGELPEPTEQPEFFYRDAIRQLFRHLETTGAVGDALAVLLTHLDNNPGALENLLESLLAKREQWLEPLLASINARDYLEQTLKNTVAETLANARSTMALVGSDLALVADYAAANLVGDNPDSPACVLAGISALPSTEPAETNLHRWLAICELLITQENQWRKPKGITKRNGFPTKKDSIDPANAELRKDQLNDIIAWCTEQPGLLELLTDLRHLPTLCYTDSQWQLLDALTQVLPLLVAELTVLFKARHSCDFTEVTLAALRALGTEDEATDLSLKLDYQIRHILVDEFQDTSSLQFRMLKKLTWGWQPGDGRTLFIVGDGMQSLYGFRNANVGIFLEARKLPVGNIQLQPLDLEVNFRSDRSVVDWVNQVFALVFPPREDISRGAVSYAAAVAARENLTSPAVTLDIFPRDSSREAEAVEVIRKIREARRVEPTGTIAILTRARSHLSAIITALQQEGISWEATDIDPLSSRMAVIDLFSLTRALINPADRIAWLAILRAPWCGLNLEDMHRLVHFGQIADGNPATLPWLPGQVFNGDIATHLSEDGRARLLRVAPILKAAWQHRYRKPLRQWVEGTWLALGGPAAVVNSSQLAWCHQYLDLLEKHSRGSDLPDREHFAQAVDKLYARPAPGGDNPVQIMTIHKSKGLEFDTVILPGLHRGGGSNSGSLLYWRERINREGEPELLIAPPLFEEEPQDSEKSPPSQLVKHLKYEEKVKNTLEDGRVLYVACTRAIKRLHLLFNTPGKGPVKGSLLASLWPAVEDPEALQSTHICHHETAPAASEAVGEEDGEPTGPHSITEIIRLAGDWQHPFPVPQNTVESSGQPYKPPVMEEHTPRHTGTVLHRTLCRIVTEGVEHWDAERIERQHKAWEIQLRQLGVTDTAASIAVLNNAVATMLADPQGLWLLDNRHQHSACELALGFRSATGYGQAVIDRTFVDNGTRWIVDYKSSSPYPDESAEDFLAREAAAYREQLVAYRDIFTAHEPGQIRTALYFPLLPALHEIH